MIYTLTQLQAAAWEAPVALVGILASLDEEDLKGLMRPSEHETQASHRYVQMIETRKLLRQARREHGTSMTLAA